MSRSLFLFVWLTESNTWSNQTFLLVLSLGLMCEDVLWTVQDTLLINRIMQQSRCLSARCWITACLSIPVYLLCFSTDIDECSTQMHYCQSNTMCVNLPGSHHCDCLPGFTRVDEYSCTGMFPLKENILHVTYASSRNIRSICAMFLELVKFF